MGLQAFLFDAEAPSDFIYPGLVLGDGLKFAVFELVGAAIANARDQQFVSGFVPHQIVHTLESVQVDEHGGGGVYGRRR